MLCPVSTMSSTMSTCLPSSGISTSLVNVIVLERCAALRRVYGGPAPENVRAQAERVRALAEELAARTDKGRNDL